MSIICPYCGKTIYIETKKATLREEIVSALGPLNELVDITGPTVEGTIIVKPKGFLGRDKFAEIARILKGFGASYVSAGRESRWEIVVQS
jgi:hypothetical protein